MTTVACIQARTGSQRLPGKVVAEILGQPMLGLHIDRVLRSSRIDRLIIATGDLPANDAVCEVARSKGVDCFRGDEDDVLDRFYRAVRPHAPDVVIRLTGDSPIVDGEFIDMVLDAFVDVDYADTTIGKTFPLGLSVEVFTFAALEAAWRETTGPWREHVTPFIYRNPERFRLLHLRDDVDRHHLRLTVDTPEDLVVVRTLFEQAGDAPWRELVRLAEEHPELQALNRHVVQRT
ncbi:MAG TPA: glycosyltransferase family protein, partial [Thermoanaerobaculia bacterium]|nr:glycosyltransferase family protein [Thermoanaerobaculia bacterium]